MTSNNLQISRSAVDEARFGIRVARTPKLTLETLSQAMTFCHENDIKLLIARTPVGEIHTAQAMEQEGFLLMDTLVYYARNLLKSPPPPDTRNVPVRPISTGEEDDVRQVASRAFSDYFGHYHADSRLDHDKAGEGYTEWAMRSCVSREVADEVLVADMDGKIVGFATLRLNNPEEGEGVLFGVAPEAQGHGIYRSFMVQAMEWCLSSGAERMVVSTQITNIAVQKVWSRVGFEPSHAYYTFHKWFD
jgi:GNAT superfamily N-acetyltransferase